MKRRGLWWLSGLGLALLIGGLLSPWASPLPDGLDSVARHLGFKERESKRPALRSPLPEYKVPGIAHERFSTAAAGIVGTLVVFGFAAGVGALLARPKRQA